MLVLLRSPLLSNSKTVLARHCNCQLNFFFCCCFFFAWSSLHADHQRNMHHRLERYPLIISDGPAGTQRRGCRRRCGVIAPYRRRFDVVCLLVWIIISQLVPGVLEIESLRTELVSVNGDLWFFCLLLFVHLFSHRNWFSYAAFK